MNQHEFLLNETFSSDAQPAGSETPGLTPHSAIFDGSLTADLLNSDNTSLSISSNDVVLIGCWVKFTSQGTVLLAGKFWTGSGGEYDLSTDANQVYMEIKIDALGGTVSVADPGTLVDGIKYFILGYANPVAQKVYIKVNGGTITSNDYGVIPVFTGSQHGIVEIGGGTAFGTNSLDGSIDEVFICKNPPSLTTALSTINTLYNSGTGTKFSGLTTQQKTDIGLVAWWGLDETTGTRKDLVGTVDLTPTGIIAGTPLVS